MEAQQAHQTGTTRNVAIPAELHRRAKLAATARGATLQSIVAAALTRGLDEIPNQMGTAGQDVVPSADRRTVDGEA